VKALERLESGIDGLDGLDAITHGGFVAGAAYLIQGRPGSGKTIFANQVAFHHTAQGGKVIFASLLSEPHDRLFQYLSTLSFFNSAEIGAGMLYVSAFDTLENEGLDEVLKLLRREIIRHKATLLVLDGLMNVRSRSDTPLNTKKFVAELQVHASFAGCTTLLLTSAEIDHGSPELTMVDGVFSLKEERVGMRSYRRLGVHKYRGSDYVSGEHEYEITSNGIAIYPRIEALLSQPTAPLSLGERMLPTGIEGLDEALGGGFIERSATLVIGPSGAGKTTLRSISLPARHRTNMGLSSVSSSRPNNCSGNQVSLSSGLKSRLSKGASTFIGNQRHSSFLIGWHWICSPGSDTSSFLAS